MKTLIDKSEVLVSGGSDTARLTIAANSKAFKELISGIYSDKAGAICRELFSNAVDSHIEAGTPDRIFDVQVPNILEPHFACRDYGVSMTHKDVMTVYSTLFESTKDDQDDDKSNTVTGKFGLGSKTPFAYTDAFQLTTYLDGTMRNYDIFLDEGIPTISMFMSTDTDEENGVLITFPVENDDHEDFRRATKKACLGLDIIPNFINCDFEFEMPVPSYEGENWKMYKSDSGVHYRGSNEKLRIRQGTVIYPLNVEAITVDLTSEQMNLFPMNLVVTVPIGKVEVNTAREALSYDDRTSQNIADALTGIHADVVKQLTVEKENIKTFYEFCIWHREQRQKVDSWIFDAVFQNLKFKGKPAQHNLFTTLPTEKFTSEAGHIGTRYKSGFHVCYLNEKDQDLKTMAFKHDRNISTHHGFSNNNKKSFSVSLDAKLHIVYENLEEELSLQSSKVKNYSLSLPSRSTILWIKGNGSPLKEIARIAYNLGYPDMAVVNMNSLERLPRQDYDYVTEKPSDFHRPYRYSNFDYPRGDEVAPDEAYYVPLFRKHPELGTGHSMYDMFRAYKELCEMGIMKKLPIVGINQSEKSKLRHFPQWLNFADTVMHMAPMAPKDDDVYRQTMQRLLNEKLGDHSQDILTTCLKDTRDEYDQWSTDRWNKHSWNLDKRYILKAAAKKTDIWEFYSEYRRFDALKDAGVFKSTLGAVAQLVSKENMIANHPKAVLRAEKDTAKYRKLYRQFKKDFPLLTHLKINQESMNEVRRYLKLVD